MTSSTRSCVLAAFKKLHRARLDVFAGDPQALNIARVKINDEFRKNKSVENEIKIQKLLELAEGSEKTLRECVVQTEYNPKTKAYRAKITKHTEMTDDNLTDPSIFDGTRKKCGDDSIP